MVATLWAWTAVTAAPPGYVERDELALLPVDPDASAARLRAALRELLGSPPARE